MGAGMGVRMRWTKRTAPARLGRTSGGFTMVEILVTMLFLSIVLVGLAALQLATIRSVTSSRLAAQADRLAHSRIEFYQSLSWSNFPSPATWNNPSKKNGTEGMINVAVDGESPGPFTVWEMIEASGTTSRALTVRVSWTDVTASTTATAGTMEYRTQNVFMSLLRSP
jgi:Tfp pilus assembly protein PilV